MITPTTPDEVITILTELGWVKRFAEVLDTWAHPSDDRLHLVTRGRGFDSDVPADIDLYDTTGDWATICRVHAGAGPDMCRVLLTAVTATIA